MRCNISKSEEEGEEKKKKKKKWLLTIRGDVCFNTGIKTRDSETNYHLRRAAVAARRRANHQRGGRREEKKIKIVAFLECQVLKGICLPLKMKCRRGKNDNTFQNPTAAEGFILLIPPPLLTPPPHPPLGAGQAPDCKKNAVGDSRLPRLLI